MSENLTVAEALHQAAQIEGMLDAIEGTSPDAVQAMGGRDALARRSEMTCIGPVPRLDAETWERMSQEYEGGASMSASIAGTKGHAVATLLFEPLILDMVRDLVA